MSTLAVDNIGLLVTNDPDGGEGPLGVVRDAALVFGDGRVIAVQDAGALADERIDAGGGCVIPGFVDSHTHLVFAGDRSEEFAARMAGAPYAAGGIRLTVESTRAASEQQLADSREHGAARLCALGSPIRRSSRDTRSMSRTGAASVPARRGANRRRHVPRGSPRAAGICGSTGRVRRPGVRRDAPRLRATCPLDRRVL